MERYVDILFRLGRLLARVPPELLGAMILVAGHPAALVAPVAYVANLLGSEIVVLLLLYLWTRIVWPHLPLKVRGAILRVRDYFLPARPPAQDDDPSGKTAALEARVRELERRLEGLETGAQGDSSGPPGTPKSEGEWSR